MPAILRRYKIFYDLIENVAISVQISTSGQNHEILCSDLVSIFLSEFSLN